MSAPKGKINVGILGATGTVGQRFIQLLENHPFFVISHIGASERSAGKPYSLAANWKVSSSIPPSISQMTVSTCDPANFPGCKIIFSGLDADVAGTVESNFANAGFCVFSNAKNHRMDPVTPLVVPLVNTSHFDILPHQAQVKGFGKGGFIVTNANCATTGLVVPLKALADKFGKINKLYVVTMQAISGAGYPGVPSLDIFDNVVPYIGGEEEKLEIEVGKIMGELVDGKSFKDADVAVSAQCNRVAVLDGHMECVSFSFAADSKPTIEQVKECLASYVAEPTVLGVPSAPKQAIIIKEENNRPQPRLDRENEKGNAVTVGRIRKCNLFDFKLVLLSHNTILGAAGSSIMNAEVAVYKGFITV